MIDSITRSRLMELYYDEKKTKKQIAKEHRCSQARIRLLMQELTINTKDSYKRINSARPNKEVLEQLYLKEHLSTVKISKQFNTTPRSILDWLRSYNIARRTLSEACKLRQPIKKGKSLKRLSGQGYVFLYEPNHPKANADGYIREHVLVWEKFHNKPLPKGYIIHHLNGVKSDNRPENLVAMSRARHTDQASPYKKRIRQLEIEIEQLRRALANNQLIFYLGDN